MYRWFRALAIGSLTATSLLLTGCPNPDVPSAPDETTPPVAVRPAGPDGRACEEIKNVLLAVGEASTARVEVELQAEAAYVVYVAAADDDIDPTLQVLDAAGNLLAENDDFLNARYCAVSLVPTKTQTVTIEVGCYEDRTGNAVLRVQRAGWLVDGTVVEGNMEDFQGFYFYAFEADKGVAYQATTQDLRKGADTLLTLLRPENTLRLAQNDDIGPDELASQVLWRCHEKGIYLLAVTASSVDGIGPYKLRFDRIVEKEL